MRNEVLFAMIATLGLNSAAKGAESAPQVTQPPLAASPLTGMINYSPPLFPVALRGEVVGDGLVVLAFTVGTNGKVIDSVALEATRSEFADSALAAVKEWQFGPGAATDPSPRREVVEFAFRRSGVVTVVQRMDAAREAFIPGTLHSQIRTVKVSELDAPLKRLAAPMPVVTAAQLSQRGKTPLMVNFVIDTAGNTRVPVTTVADPTLAQAVLDAVKQWRYEPPMQNGVPVLVEATRSLVLPGAVANGT